MKILFSIAFVFIFCSGQLVNRANLPFDMRPTMYHNNNIRKILSNFSLLTNLIFVLFIFYDWKLLILLSIFCLTIGTLLITPLIEMLLSYISIKWRT